MIDLDGLRAALAKGTPGPWWNSHDQPAAGDKSLWDEWEALDTDPNLSEPMDNGRAWNLIFAGDVEYSPDTDLIVEAVNALPSLIAAAEQLERFRAIVAAAEIWRHWWLKTHGKTFVAGDPGLEEILELRDAAELTLEHEVAALTKEAASV